MHELFSRCNCRNRILYYLRGFQKINNHYFNFFRWLPKAAMRPVGPDSLHSDCVLVVGVSRPKLAAVFLTVMLISLFLTFHVLYDSAVYSIQVNNICLKNRIATTFKNYLKLTGSVNYIRQQNTNTNESNS